MSGVKEYNKVVKGKLSFKGDKPKSGSVLGKRSSSSSSEQTSANTASSSNKKPQTGQAEVKDIEILPGTGRMTSSGTTVQGHFTDFMGQLSVGDAVIITHPSTLQEETKIVRMVLSNVSIGLSSAFSSDLISTTPFRYIKAPKDEENEDEKERQATLKKHKAEETAFGTYASAGGSQFTYRVKKDGAYGGYKIMTESTHGALSREELLDKRTKKKSDRFCY